MITPPPVCAISAAKKTPTGGATRVMASTAAGNDSPSAV
jgi:hypothetical protein